MRQSLNPWGRKRCANGTITDVVAAAIKDQQKYLDDQSALTNDETSSTIYLTLGLIIGCTVFIGLRDSGTRDPAVDESPMSRGR